MMAQQGCDEILVRMARQQIRILQRFNPKSSRSSMKSILVTVLLMIVVIGIYFDVVGGSTGTRRQVSDSGGRINGSIERINP